MTLEPIYIRIPGYCSTIRVPQRLGKGFSKAYSEGLQQSLFEILRAMVPDGEHEEEKRLGDA